MSAGDNALRPPQPFPVLAWPRETWGFASAPRHVGQRALRGAGVPGEVWGPREGLGVPTAHWRAALGTRPNFTFHAQSASQEETVTGREAHVQEGAHPPPASHHLISPPPAAFTETLQPPGAPSTSPSTTGFSEGPVSPPHTPARCSHLLERGAERAPGTLFPFSPLFFLAFFFFETFFKQELSGVMSEPRTEAARRGACHEGGDR